MGLQRLLHPPWALESVHWGAWEVRYQVPTLSLWGSCQLKGSYYTAWPQNAFVFFFICLHLHLSGIVSCRFAPSQSASVFVCLHLHLPPSSSVYAFIHLRCHLAPSLPLWGSHQLKGSCCFAWPQSVIDRNTSPTSRLHQPTFVCLRHDLFPSSSVSVVVPWWYVH